jgi:U2 small nuclear ribonucleoprotein A'
VLQDLDSLSTLPRLKYLSLLDNPVTKQPNYRLYVVGRCKKLKVLDFKKIKQKVSGWDGRWGGCKGGCWAGCCRGG